MTDSPGGELLPPAVAAPEAIAEPAPPALPKEETISTEPSPSPVEPETKIPEEGLGATTVSPDPKSGAQETTRPSTPKQSESDTTETERTTAFSGSLLGDAEQTSVSSRSHFSTGLSVDSDNDSAMGDMSGHMSTMSLRSSIYEFVEENGRTYHSYKQGKYPMPNDRVEQERLDLQHAVFLQLLGGKLGLAPITNPHAVLDIGTGTGIWAIEYACQFPSAEVIGTDLSPIQPEFVPPNCSFEVDDADDEWIFNQSFDYVHLRLVFHGFKSHQGVMKSAFTNMAPGGWMEWQDYYCDLQAIDSSMKGTALELWVHRWIQGAKNLGRDVLVPPKYRRWMEEAGFINVTEQKLAIPGNPWPKGKDMKMMGLWQMTNFLDGIEAVSMAIFTKGLGMSHEEVQVFLVDVRNDIKNHNIHFYFLTYVVYGQKPLDSRSITASGGE